MTPVVCRKNIVVVYSPREGKIQNDWLQHCNHLINNADTYHCHANFYDLSSMMHDLRYFSADERSFLQELAEEIVSSDCRFVWFAGDGICEAVELIVRLARRAKKETSYVALRRGTLSRFLRWYAVPIAPPEAERAVNEAEQLGIPYAG